MPERETIRAEEIARRFFRILLPGSNAWNCPFGMSNERARVNSINELRPSIQEVLNSFTSRITMQLVYFVRNFTVFTCKLFK